MFVFFIFFQAVGKMGGRVVGELCGGLGGEVGDVLGEYVFVLFI